MHAGPRISSDLRPDRPYRAPPDLSYVTPRLRYEEAQEPLRDEEPWQLLTQASIEQK